MFKKILIANRGEIASRIIRTCKRLNIETVAVYSEADQEAPFVKEADFAFLLGGPRVNESYVNTAKILEIAKEHDVEAIHPGYGFLSENSEFARECIRENIVFIGPSPDVIELMGQKTKAREAMEKSGVPVVPGISYPLADAEEAVRVAEKLGYPVMLKASAGGGGIGMQSVSNEIELTKAYEGNQNRAQSFFGNGDMFLEKVIVNPRHIEIQVLADKQGNAVYLWERECSIQRRNQKVVEEAPSPFVDESLRKRMGETALKAVRDLGYYNAGTFEFLMDEQKNFYFLEMNTRLQVEHPVTEEITGIDMVEEQIRIAYGENLRFIQDDIRLEGHAIEVRVYAEDPVTFLPSPGQITHLKLPNGPGVRNEVAISGNSKVTPFYDPMIAKLIVSAPSREATISGMTKALQNYEIQGIKTNLPMLLTVIEHEAFKAGDTTTGFIEANLKKMKNR